MHSRHRKLLIKWVAALAATTTAITLLVPTTAQAEEKSTLQLIGNAERYAPAYPTAKKSSAPRTQVGRSSATIFGQGSQVTLTALDEPNSLVRVKEEGVQALTVLRKGSTAARYSVTLPAGQRLRPTPDGGYAITDRGGGAVYGLVRPPWAVDARGKRLSTFYRLQGSVIVQDVMAQGAAYPIVADPWLSWYSTYLNVNFTRGEVAWLAGHSDYWQLAAAICARVPGGWPQVICGVVVGAYAITWANSVKNAARYGQCWYLSFWYPIPYYRPVGGLRGWGGFWC